jgi:hypothetical protein
MPECIDQSVKCAECGAALVQGVNTPLDARVPCLSCGSIRRLVSVSLTASVQVSGHLSALHERQGEAIGFSKSERRGRTSGASQRVNGSVEMSIVGSSPRGQEDTNATCQMLKERLDLDGARWGNITSGNEPADCVLVDRHEANRALQVQLVRAVVSQKLWRTLNSEGSSQCLLSPAAAVAEFRAAIEAKADDRKISRHVRSKLVLALDATRLPGLTFDAIVREFRSTNLTWTASHGFAAVWPVGLTSRLVWRLDS